MARAYQPIQLIPPSGWQAMFVPQDEPTYSAPLLLAIALVEDVHSGERAGLGWGVSGPVEDEPDFFRLISPDESVARYQDDARAHLEAKCEEAEEVI